MPTDPIVKTVKKIVVILSRYSDLDFRLPELTHSYREHIFR